MLGTSSKQSSHWHPSAGEELEIFDLNLPEVRVSPMLKVGQQSQETCVNFVHATDADEIIEV